MKDHKYGKYIVWGVTAFLVIVACILVTLMLLRWQTVRGVIGMINEILAPIIYGAILAYLMSPVYNRLYGWMGALLKKKKKEQEKGQESEQETERRRKLVTSVSRTFATVGSLLFLAAVVIGLISMIIPTVVESIMGIVNSIPSYVQKISSWIQTIFANNPEVETAVMNAYQHGVDRLLEWTRSTANWMPNLETALSSVYSGVMGIVNVTKNSLIGVIVMIYLLLIKDTLIAQAKKIAYGLFPIGIANGLVEKCQLVHKMFGGFILGKLIDSLIIGILTFIIMSILKMPYTMLISVIIGVTNIIPFFGPFIGAIPSAVLLLLVSPKQCLIFLVLILLIQQFDGNILGPKILGNSTGLSSFWVLFSILFFGGIIIGVPTFAVISQLVKETVEKRLKKKSLSVNTDDYRGLKYIDEDRKTFVR